MIKHVLISVTFLFTFSFPAFAQTGSIKVKKALSQDKMTTVVTISGLYYGDCSIDKILSDKKLKLSNTNNQIKILDFTVDLIAGGTLYSYSCKSDTLSNEVVEKINSIRESKRLRLNISPIRATTSKQDTIFLNPIEIRLTNLQ